ncbi:MAG: hypothetical protein MUO21_07545 [Nitrososphaeraceae archaeon]|nr:hypothetical protein [Nitrososphaeraceae archaeon]
MENLDLDLSIDDSIEINSHKLSNKLLRDIYHLLFRKDLCVFGLSAIEYFLSKPKIHTHVIDVCTTDDKSVVEIIKKLGNVLSFSYDLHIRMMHHEDHEDDPKCTCGQSDLEDVIMANITLHYRYVPGICFHINIHQGPLEDMDLIFDFDAICVTDMDTITINNINYNYKLSDAVKAANEKKFRLVDVHIAPEESRSEMGIISNTNGVLRYLEISGKTTNLLNDGWKIIGPRLDKVFYPCLIGKAPENGKCSICNDKFRKYELKLDCCSQFMCFKCAVTYVKSRADNSEIPCPFCKEDPFGWGTIY